MPTPIRPQHMRRNTISVTLCKTDCNGTSTRDVWHRLFGRVFCGVGGRRDFAGTRPCSSIETTVLSTFVMLGTVVPKVAAYNDI